MSNTPSREKWRNLANFEAAENDNARAQAQGTTVENIREQDEADRLAKMPDAVEAENQEAITEAMQDKLNDQYADAAPVASVESGESTSNSLFGFDGDASGDDSEALTNDQDTGGLLFGDGQSQDNDNGDGL